MISSEETAANPIDNVKSFGYKPTTVLSGSQVKRSCLRKTRKEQKLDRKLNLCSGPYEATAMSALLTHLVLENTVTMQAREETSSAED